eukprot:3403401-Rhodomonas_salina.3
MLLRTRRALRGTNNVHAASPGTLSLSASCIAPYWPPSRAVSYQVPRTLTSTFLRASYALSSTHSVSYTHLTLPTICSV